MSDLRSDRPTVTHRLALAFRFVDAFSGGEVSVPLDVSAPSLPFVPGVLMPPVPWESVAFRNVYRFATTNNETAPVGAIDFQVLDPTGIYASFEKITVALPLPVSTPPVPSDFLVENTLWPTRMYRPHAPETETVLVVKSGGATNIAGLQVRVWKHTGGPPPATPYTYTDASGEALFRLLGSDFTRTLTGGPTVAVDLELRLPPLFTTTVAILSPPLPITIDLGTTTTLILDVP